MKNTKKIIWWFIGWRVWLFFVAFVASLVIKKFNPSFPYFDTILKFTKVPSWIWGFGNFDGVHYLRIAATGYKDEFAQAFFPLFPILINLITRIIPNVFRDLQILHPQYIGREYFYGGILLSNALFLAGLYWFYKLLSFDYKDIVPKQSVIMLLSFPTAFYFGSVYSESLFFLLTVLFFYFLRKEKFLLSGIFAMLASSTRIVGIIFILVLIIEYLYTGKGLKSIFANWKKLLSILLAPMGTIFYMYFLGKKFGDYLFFLTAQPQFGAERSSIPIITLPQVFYRYIKMLLTVNPLSYQFFVLVLEISFAILAVIILIYTFRKLRPSYWFFSLSVFLIPTLTGTFSSIPRYILMCFLLFPLVVKLSGKYYKAVIIFNFILQAVLVGLFIRGYWIA